MEKRYIKVGQQEYDRIFVGNDEYEYGFVGSEQFFGPLTVCDVQFSNQSVFEVGNIVCVDDIDNCEYSVKWYYNTEKSLNNATIIGTQEILDITSDYIGNYICAEVTVEQEYHYPNVYVIYSDTPISNKSLININATARTYSSTQISVGNSLQYTINLVQSGTTTQITDYDIENMSVEVVNHPIIENEDILPQFTISIEGGKYYLKITTNEQHSAIGAYTLKVKGIETEKYNAFSTANINFNVVKGNITIDNLQLTGNYVYGEQVSCTLQTVPSDCEVTYQWYRSDDTIIEEYNTSIITIDNTDLINDKIYCRVTVSKDKYNIINKKSDLSSVIKKGSRSIAFTEYNGEDIIQLVNISNQKIHFVNATNSGNYIIMVNNIIVNNDYNTGKYHINIDEDKQYIEIYTTDNTNMLSMDTIQLYVASDEGYNASNILTLYVQTITSKWENVSVTFKGGYYINNTLSIETRNGIYDIEVSDLKWYIINEPTESVSGYTPISTDNEFTLTNDCVNKYIKCQVTLINNTLGQSGVYEIVTPIINSYNITAHFSDGTPYYGQKITVTYRIN